eukprot:2695484-Amphidinium_carterae.1
MNTLGNGTSGAPAVAQEILFDTQLKLQIAHPCYAHLHDVRKSQAASAIGVMCFSIQVTWFVRGFPPWNV